MSNVTHILPAQTTRFFLHLFQASVFKRIFEGIPEVIDLWAFPQKDPHVPDHVMYLEAQGKGKPTGLRDAATGSSKWQHLSRDDGDLPPSESRPHGVKKRNCPHKERGRRTMTHNTVWTPVGLVLKTLRKMSWRRNAPVLKPASQVLRQKHEATSDTNPPLGFSTVQLQKWEKTWWIRVPILYLIGNEAVREYND